MRIYIIAGEVSGDLHGANLIRAMQSLEKNIEIEGWGGDRMQQTGIKITKHIRELAFMGLWEVILNLRKIQGFFRQVKDEISAFKPHCIVYVDYPGFNMRVASWAKKNGYLNIYYITPKVWAWHSSRVKALHKNFSKLINILPFEPMFFQQWSVESVYVGHPLVDAIDNYIPDPVFANDKSPYIALFPGSREQEIRKMLPVMLSIVNHFHQYKFYISQVNSVDPKITGKIIDEFNLNEKVELIADRNYDLLRNAELAVIASGTASLEAAFFYTPQVVCYKTNWLTYFIAKQLVKVKYLSLVNIILKTRLVPELIQRDLNPDNLIKAMTTGLQPEQRTEMQKAYGRLKEVLSLKSPSLAAAEIVFSTLKKI